MSALLDSRSEQFFDLDGKSGIVSTSRKLDREEMDVHYFKIVASNGGRTGTATLQVRVWHKSI
jgi:cadherin EGF LAG seven-pass G-type receptor 1